MNDHAGHRTEVVEFNGTNYELCHDCKKTIGRVCEVYSRIVGYLRPVNQWNPGKKAEWEQRKVYKGALDGRTVGSEGAE